MCGLIEYPWHPDDQNELPSQTELDELAAQWTEEEREAEEARLMDLCYGRVPARLRRGHIVQIDEEEAA